MPGMRKTIYVSSEGVWDEVKEKSAAMDLSVSAYLLGGSHISSSMVSIESLSSRLDRIEVKLDRLLGSDLTGENLDVALFEASHSDSEYIKESAKLREELMKLPLEPGGVLEVDSMEECDIIEAARDSARAQLDAARANIVEPSPSQYRYIRPFSSSANDAAILAEGQAKLDAQRAKRMVKESGYFNPQPKGKKGK